MAAAAAAAAAAGVGVAIADKGGIGIAGIVDVGASVTGFFTQLLHIDGHVQTAVIGISFAVGGGAVGDHVLEDTLVRELVRQSHRELAPLVFVGIIVVEIARPMGAHQVAVCVLTFVVVEWAVL